MALIHCPECQHEVSTLAASCPNCGYLMQPQTQSRSLQDDPDLVRLVERERRRREWAPVTIAVAVIVLIFSLIAFASSMARLQRSQTQYHTCTQSDNWPPSPDATWTSGSISISEVGDGTPCP